MFTQASEDARAYLEAAFRTAIIFDQLAAFSGGDKATSPDELISSAGMAIWASAW